MPDEKVNHLSGLSVEILQNYFYMKDNGNVTKCGKKFCKDISEREQKYVIFFLDFVLLVLLLDI